jgi:purine-binding chemotaxis protein CheW
MQSGSAGSRDQAINAHYLISRTHSWLCALPIASVRETMRPLPCEPLAQMPPFLLGVSIIRGAAVPVINVASLLGFSDPAQFRRIVTLKVGERAIALAVEEVVGIRAIALGSEQTPPLLHRVAEDAVSAIATLDQQLLYVLESACLVPESVWQSMTQDASRQ